jgi:hypothetical protein
MTTLDCITALFTEVDEQLRAIPKHPEAHLWPSEVVTLGLLHALKGVGNCALYRWLTRDSRALFPGSPSGRGSYASSRPTRTRRRPAWSPRPCSASLTPLGSHGSIRYATAAVPNSLAAKVCRITVGWSGAKSVCYGTSTA